MTEKLRARGVSLSFFLEDKEKRETLEDYSLWLRELVFNLLLFKKGFVLGTSSNKQLPSSISLVCLWDFA